MSPNSKNKFSYCINKLLCSNLENPGHKLKYCQSCGAKLLVGDRYRLIKRLNKDNAHMDKKVFEAIDTLNSNNRVIAKIIDYTNSPFAKYLKREHDFLYSAVKPFPQVKKEDYFEWSPDPENNFLKTYVLILPKYEGIDTLDWIHQHGAITESQCINWIFSILDYLETFADMAYIYRDLKPENIILQPDQKIKLIDFESVKKIDSEYLSIMNSDIDSNDSADIQRGTRLFTFAYSPPEQLQGKPLPQSDFYSLGRTAMHWISGKNPANLGDGVDNTSINWSDVRPEISKTFINFLNWLTDRDPRKRPVNANTIRSYLEYDYPRILKNERRRKSTLFKFGVFTLLGFATLCGLALFTLGLSKYYSSSGSQALIDGDYQSAKKKLERSHLIYPYDIYTLHNLALVCEYLDNPNCIKENLNKAININKNNSSSYYLMGLFFDKKNDFTQASKYYNLSIKVRPSDTESLNRIGRLKILSGKYNEAEKILNNALKYEREKTIKYKLQEDKELIALIKKNLGWLAFIEKKYQLSINYLNESTNLWAKNADSFCLLAQNLDALGRADEAKANWIACLSLPSDKPEVSRWKDKILKNLLP